MAAAVPAEKPFQSISRPRHETTPPTTTKSAVLSALAARQCDLPAAFIYHHVLTHIHGPEKHFRARLQDVRLTGRIPDIKSDK